MDTVMWMELVFIWIETEVRRAVTLLMPSVCTNPVLGSHPILLQCCASPS
jgi:hypothetical protein